MGKFKELEVELENCERSALTKQAKILEQAVSIIENDLENDIDFKESLSKLESSKELTSGEEFFKQWIRFDPSQYIDTDSELQKSAFELYLLNSHNYEIDFKNDALMLDIGPSIIINEDGDVLDQDSGKWIISKDKYSDKFQLYQLIEKYMEDSGYFPSVILCDRYGNAFYVDTKRKNSDGK